MIVDGEWINRESFMKLLLIFAVIPFFNANATNLDIKPGNWDYEVSMNFSEMPQMKAAMDSIKNLPPQQRAMAEQMMKQKMESFKKSQHCITKSDINNWEAKMKKEISKDGNMSGCTFKKHKLTKKTFIGEYLCKDKTKNVKMEVQMENPKKGKTKIYTSMTKKPMITTMTWASSNCKK